jgi:ADP-heptose:LPS heptosyltransferase
MPDMFRHILILDLSPFGQSLPLLPAVRALRAAHPRTFIMVAASRGACELLAASRLVDETIDLGVIKSSNQNFGGALKRVARLFKRTRRTDPDLVLDLSPRLETQIFTGAVLRSRAVTPSKLHDVLGRLLSRAGGAGRASSHAAECQSALKQIGIEAPLDRLSIDLLPEEDARFERLLANKGSRGGQPVVILYSGGGGAAAERWPVESFGETGARLANNFAARIVAVDEPGDNAFTDAIATMLPRDAIKLSEGRAVEIVAAVARASLVITDDAGLAEMAIDLGAPALEISRFKPSSGLPKNRRVAHSPALARITTDEVYEMASEMLQESRLISLFER